MIAPIVVGVDGSPTALRAAHRAGQLAASLRAPLYVVAAHVHDEFAKIKSGTDRWVFSDQKNALEVAKNVATDLEAPELNVHSVALHGKPSEVLLDYAEKVNAQMIVVGNQRMRGISRVLGSVANAVSHNSRCDVLIVNTYET